VSYPPPGPNDPYGQNPYGQNPYGQPPQQPQQPGYGSPQQPPPGQPGYGYPPQQGYPPPYGYPQPGAGGVPPAPEGYANVPNLGIVQVASYGARFGARLIDFIIVWLVYAIFSFIALGGMASSSKTSSGGAVIGAFVLSYLVLAVFLIGYEVIFVTAMGATLGKKMLGLHIADIRTGMKPGFGSALARWGFPIGLGLFTCFLGSILIFISPFFDNSGRLRGWHDKAANTLVLKY
jgi:uncharacterized RDD family membrane protein YckC